LRDAVSREKYRDTARRKKKPSQRVRKTNLQRELRSPKPSLKGFYGKRTFGRGNGKEKAYWVDLRRDRAPTDMREQKGYAYKKQHSQRDGPKNWSGQREALGLIDNMEPGHFLGKGRGDRMRKKKKKKEEEAKI